ncbi:MAG: NADH-quinone oxidoreductase subunit N [Acidimicrobiia bacterium]|nr:NADH-quinone oxidoreductase subunit N [Acidimicrobiia bacterium]
MNPRFDFHALAPELILTGVILVVLVVDLFLDEEERWRTSRLASIGLLAALIPVITLAVDGNDRVMFGGAYVVDDYALVMKGFFLVAAWVTLLISFDYIGEGDYYQGEFYFLLLTSTLGMLVIASARDLITLFVALETISLPTFVLAAWRKHDPESNEAGLKYFLIGVLSSAVMLYGMSFVFGFSGSTLLSDISTTVSADGVAPLLLVGIFMTLVGFAFKVSAVPFHFWAPDTYEGAPTPVTAFLSVASKAGGLVAMLTLVYAGFFGRPEAWQPVLWVMAAASMTLGNLVALRQTNMVRLLAYSSIAQGGFMLVPFAVAPDGSGTAATSSFEAVVIYMLIYGAMNLGAFACVIAIARRTGSAELSSYNGLIKSSPALAVTFSLFLFSLAGIPPLAGWFAKFVMFRSVLDAGTTAAVVLGVIAAINSVVAFFYYAGVSRRMILEDPAEEQEPVLVPPALNAAIALTALTTLVVGVYPQLFAKLGEFAAGVG